MIPPCKCRRSLVPRWMVGPAHDGLEGRRARAWPSDRRRSPRAIRPGGQPLRSVRSRPRRQAHASRCSCRGTWAEATLRAGKTARPPDSTTYRPWYAGRFAGIDDVVGHWCRAYRRPARGRGALPRLLLRHLAAAGGGRGGGREPRDPEIADGAAPGGRPPLVLGRLLRHVRLLPRLLHARLELRAGHAPPVPRARAHAARDRVRRRRRTRPAIRRSARRCRSASHRARRSTPPPTASSAGS